MKALINIVFGLVSLFFVQVLPFGVSLLPGSSVLIWKSFFDCNKRFFALCWIT